jgi:hypothetical protein
MHCEVIQVKRETWVLFQALSNNMGFFLGGPRKRER